MACISAGLIACFLSFVLVVVESLSHFPSMYKLMIRPQLMSNSRLCRPFHPINSNGNLLKNNGQIWHRPLSKFLETRVKHKQLIWSPVPLIVYGWSVSVVDLKENRDLN